MDMAKLRAALLTTLVVALAATTGLDFLSQRRPEPLVPATGLSQTRRLSEWHPPLSRTRGDATIYRFIGERPGGRVLVLGGSHPNEPAGYLAAVLLVENLQVEAGEVWVLPRANASAFTATDPQEGTPQRLVLPAADGTPRWFRVGGRATNPLDQWPDPEITVHRPSLQALSGIETRNLNRSFPGRADGSFTEQVAHAIRQLLALEQFDLVVDFHEAAIEYPVVNAVVAHERAGEMAAMAVLGLSMNGMEIGLEPSPVNLRGLSHRELGDHVPGLRAVLFETANPGQGRLRGRTDAAQILTGRDPCYLAAQTIPGMNKVPVDSTGLPIELRVGRHLDALRETLAALGMVDPELAVEVTGLPTLDELRQRGLSPWLSPLP
jgi:hypothetical protein